MLNNVNVKWKELLPVGSVDVAETNTGGAKTPVAVAFVVSLRRLLMKFCRGVEVESADDVDEVDESVANDESVVVSFVNCLL